jgi:hypothetical protein
MCLALLVHESLPQVISLLLSEILRNPLQLTWGRMDGLLLLQAWELAC